MPRRALLILVLMCAIACAQARPVVCAHSHADSSQHSCWLCQFGPLLCLQPTVSARLTPVVSVAWLEGPAGFEAPREVPLAARCSRGPPA